MSVVDEGSLSVQSSSRPLWVRRPWQLPAARARLRGFGARLLVAVVVTLSVVGAAGYALMAQQLRRTQIASYASFQRADVRGFEAIGRHERGMKATLTEIDQLLDAIAQRPGTLETFLIDPRSVVVASGNGPSALGQRHSDRPIRNALGTGTSYSGLENDPKRDGKDFEFVAPVNLQGARYVVEIGYDHHFLDANLQDLRRSLILIGLLALIGGTLVFYVVGGRTLMRSHRIALERATRDGLTDLPNHRAFQDEFPRAVSLSSRHSEALALIVVDLDDFKFVNDRHGHPQGDAFLRRVADVLRAGRVEDRPYRVGGDEFAIVLPHTDADGARAIAARLDRAFTAASVLVSMGISDARAGLSADDLHAQADAALYESKRDGGHRATHFDEIRDQITITTSTGTGLVRSLIDEERLTMVYQPLWDLECGRLLGVEALMRPDPDGGLAGPAEAFDLAEQIGRVHDLDAVCFKHALQSVPELPDGALLFINVSPQTLDRDAKGSTWLLDTVLEAGLAPGQIVIEVTERFGARIDAVVIALQRLRTQGFKLALDDVGTGNSGLQMLQTVGADYVKIDRGIVLGAATNSSARAVLMAMATYARQTGAYVIAEGIEDQDTLDFLQSLDENDARSGRIVQGGQGYGLARPAPDGAIDRPPGLLRQTADQQTA
jgi:diguanylate cyclase (GGDEF)-like protein